MCPTTAVPQNGACGRRWLREKYTCCFSFKREHNASHFLYLIVPSFFFSHELVSGRIERLNEEVKEVKSSRSEVLSEKKKLQEKIGDLQKVGLFGLTEKQYDEGETTE